MSGIKENDTSAARERQASLPWYDLSEVRPATDALWTALAEACRREGLRDVPETLDRSTPLRRQWRSSRLLLTQVCGYDALLSSPHEVQVVATPRYSAPGCEGPAYRSFIVVRQDAAFRSLEDLRGARCAVNTRTSHSGMNILRALISPLSHEGRFFSSVTLSGSHERSLELIRTGQVDVAAVDCVTFALIQRNRPEALGGLRILDRTKACPAPPYVTSRSTSPSEVAALRRALQSTMESPKLGAVRKTLFLEGLEMLPLWTYRPIAALAAAARDWAYEELPGNKPVPALSPL